MRCAPRVIESRTSTSQGKKEKCGREKFFVAAAAAIIPLRDDVNKKYSSLKLIKM
jgi:hypothetical protein